MTNREFLNAVVSANISDEMTAKANALIAVLDKKNESRKGKPSKTAIANEPIKQAMVNYLKGKGTVTASAVAEGMEISTQKASALLRQLAESGLVATSEVKVQGKGKVKGYTLQ